MMVTPSPFSSTPTCPDRGDAWRPTSDVRPSRSAQNGVSTVCALPGDRVLRDTELRGEEAGDEVVSLLWIGHSSHDHGGGIKPAYCSEVRGEPAESEVSV